MKAHFGVDSRSKLIYAVVATPANVADSMVLPDLLHGRETRVRCDQAYRGQRAVIRQAIVVSRTRPSGRKTAPSRRCAPGHPIGGIKRVFGFVKARYRGLVKNSHRLVVTCALANLFMARGILLRCAQNAVVKKSSG